MVNEMKNDERNVFLSNRENKKTWNAAIEGQCIDIVWVSIIHSFIQ